MKNGESLKIFNKILSLQETLLNDVHSGEATPLGVLVTMREIDKNRRKLGVSDRSIGEVSTTYTKGGTLFIEFNGSRIKNERTLCKNCGKKL